MTLRIDPIFRVPRCALLTVAVLATVAIAALAPASSRAGAPMPAQPTIQFGFNEWADPGAFPLQRQLNAPVLRMSIGWNTVQAAGAGTWDWQLADSHYQAIVNAGLKPLIVVVGSPCWAHPSVPCEGLDTAWHPPDPSFDGAWAEFNRRVASRYPKAAAIEVWNEQNIVPAYPSYPDPVRYTALLKSAYTAIKGIRKTNIPVISGGLFAAEASGPYGVADAEFLKAMYGAGAKGYMDGIGIHPYLYSTSVDGLATYDAAAIQAPLNRLRTVRDAAGANSTAFWITETGESTTTQDGFPPAATESQQANDLVTVVRAVKATPDVRALLIHRLIDRPGAGGLYAMLESGFGVYRADRTPKPAACALSHELAGSLRC